jgi:hypothetical protein
MAKQVILYNLADHVTDEQYKDYVLNEKGPLLNSLPGVEKFELIRINGSMKGEIPYTYIGIMHISDPAEFNQKALPSKEFQNFQAKWNTMVQPDFHGLMGDEVF